ncbi:MAG: ABC transporter permease [Phycisphaerae bacterium]
METTLFIESVRIAFREMRRHRTRSVLTMLGVIMGVAAIIMVVSVSQGAKRQIQGQIANLGTNMIVILPESTTQGGVRGGTGSGSSLTMADAEAIGKECSAVALASAVTRMGCQAVSELANWSVQVTGADPNYTEVRSWKIEQGRAIEARDVDAAAKVCLIGRTTAEQLFGRDDPIRRRIRVKGTPMEVVGLLAEKGQSPLGEDQDDTIVVPITTYFRYLSGGDRPNAIIASAASEQEIDLALHQITNLLRQRHQLREDDVDDFTAKSLAEAARTAESSANVMTTLLVSIASISLLVGGVGIMNIMLVTVMERTREIGIRMAVGATRQMIMQQFMMEAATLAGIGGLFGIAFGLLGTEIVTRLTAWPAILSPFLLIAPPVFAVVIGMIFGLLPARRAARMNPVESLRHE